MIARIKQTGFSLIELLIVIVMIGILSSLAAPSYQEMIENTKIRTAAESIQSGFQIARAEAVKRNRSVQFDFRGTSSDWTVCVSPAAAGSCPSGNNIQSRKKSEGSSTNVAVNPTPNGPYVFDGFGVMTSPGKATVEVTGAASGSRDLHIVVGAGGSVKVCDPALSTTGTDPRRCPA